MMERIDAPFLDGWFAHKNRYGPMVPTNPYAMLTQAYSHSQWRAGYNMRLDADTHNLKLEYDDAIRSIKQT